jgi:hypothetical protein
MSRGKNLQEMEVGTKQSKTAVNASAKPADAMQKLAPGAVAGQTGSWEDLGGPTPDNYKSDDDSSKLKTPGATLKQVKDIVNKGAKPADTSKGVKEEEELDDEDLIEEETEDEDVVSEAKDKEDGDDEEDGDDDDDDDEEEEEEVEEEFNIDEDVNALLEGEELSEEFQEKAKTIFEAALRSKVSQIRENLEEQYTAALAEEVEEIKTELAERVDAYLEYVADEWMQENQLTIQSGIKEELTDSFITGLKGLFEEHYVSIPEDKYNVLESMVEKLDDMETKLNEQIEKNISLNKRLAESLADGIFDEISEGLALSQKEKLASLVESVEFESDQEYREKLETLKEAYFPSRVVSQMAKTETLSEGADVAPEFNTNTMNAYLRALSVTAPKN